MTDFRALCARMADELDHYRQLLMDDRRATHALATEARAALAQPGPQGPTDEELLGIEDLEGAWNAQADAFNSWGALGIDEIVWWAQRQALARWGRSAIEPVPVSERLPGPEDCDAEGRCWWYHPETFSSVACWCYSRGNGTEKFYLPYWALPVPSSNSTTLEEQ
jgi:hypothetical protein